MDFTPPGPTPGFMPYIPGTSSVEEVGMPAGRSRKTSASSYQIPPGTGHTRHVSFAEPDSSSFYPAAYPGGPLPSRSPAPSFRSTHSPAPSFQSTNSPAPSFRSTSTTLDDDSNSEDYQQKEVLPPLPDHERPRVRKLIVCIDGTNKKFGLMNSNVVELYNRIVKSDEQLTYYSSGLGTYAKHIRYQYLSRRLSNNLNLMFAWNLEKEILAAYRWISDNYKDGDQIFLFGFSRGAYQVRALAGMIEKVGLILKGNENQIPFAFELYADLNTKKQRKLLRHTKPGNPSLPSDSSHIPQPVTGVKSSNSDNATNRLTNVRSPCLEDKIGNEELAAQFKETFSRPKVKVYFVGVWDTVSSVGISRREPLPLTNAYSHIGVFRQALALDERRVKFLPEYVLGGATATEDLKSAAASLPHVKEVWFAGSHSDIGGGSRPNAYLNLADAPLLWIANEATMAGLHFKMPKVEWDWHDLKERGPTDSLRKWRLLEYLPIKRLNYKGQDTITSDLHAGQGRTMLPGQKIHASLAFASPDYKPAATLPEGCGITWETLVGKGDVNTFGQRKDLSSIVEMDLFDFASAPQLLQRLSTDNNAQLVKRLAFMTRIESSAQAVTDIVYKELGDGAGYTLARLLQLPDSEIQCDAAGVIAVFAQDSRIRRTIVSPEVMDILANMLRKRGRQYRTSAEAARAVASLASYADSRRFIVESQDVLSALLTLLKNSSKVDHIDLETHQHVASALSDLCSHQISRMRVFREAKVIKTLQAIERREEEGYTIARNSAYLFNTFLSYEDTRLDIMKADVRLIDVFSSFVRMLEHTLANIKFWGAVSICGLAHHGPSIAHPVATGKWPEAREMLKSLGSSHESFTRRERKMLAAPWVSDIFRPYPLLRPPVSHVPGDSPYIPAVSIPSYQNNTPSYNMHSRQPSNVTAPDYIPHRPSSPHPVTTVPQTSWGTPSYPEQGGYSDPPGSYPYYRTPTPQLSSHRIASARTPPHFFEDEPRNFVDGPIARPMPAPVIAMTPGRPRHNRSAPAAHSSSSNASQSATPHSSPSPIAHQGNLPTIIVQPSSRSTSDADAPSVNGVADLAGEIKLVNHAYPTTLTDLSMPEEYTVPPSPRAPTRLLQPTTGVQTEVYEMTPRTLRSIRRVVVIGISWGLPLFTPAASGLADDMTNKMTLAVDEYLERHEERLDKLTKIPLLAGGAIRSQLEELWRQYLSNQEWVDDLQRSDAILLATHYQGAILATHLLQRLINIGHIRMREDIDVAATRWSGFEGDFSPQLVSCLALDGTHLGADYHERYLDEWENPRNTARDPASAVTQELLKFQKPQSDLSHAYGKALGYVLKHGVKFTYVVDVKHSAVPIYSACFATADHPSILRILHIDDGIESGPPEFLLILLDTLFSIRNAGLQDRDLITYLSKVITEGISPVGRSSGHPDIGLQVYNRVIQSLFDEVNVLPPNAELKIHTFKVLDADHDEEIAWAVHDLLIEPQVAATWATEFEHLRVAFDNWDPNRDREHQAPRRAALRKKLEPVIRRCLGREESLRGRTPL